VQASTAVTFELSVRRPLPETNDKPVAIWHLYFWQRLCVDRLFWINQFVPSKKMAMAFAIWTPIGNEQKATIAEASSLLAENLDQPRLRDGQPFPDDALSNE
jgi:hypothetical protein